MTMLARPLPSRTAVFLLLPPLLLALMAPWLPQLLPLLWVLDGVVIGLLLLDLLLGLMASRHLHGYVRCAGVWSLARPEAIHVHLEWRGRRRLDLWFAPDCPSEISIDELPQRRVLPPRKACEWTLRALAGRRGNYVLHGCHCALPSPLGLWRIHIQRGTSERVRVYPNLRRAGEYALLARTNRLGLIGVRSAAGSGDLEFERLRPFLSGDPLARIDWKATARQDRPVVREFRAERNQNLVILVDSGRMLGGRAQAEGAGNGERLMDRSIDAALLLAHVALSQGDRVGLIAYANGPRRSVPLGGGKRQFAHLIHALHDLEAETVESRHDLAFLHLRHHVRQRSLVILISSLLDQVNARMVQQQLSALVGKHLPLGVFLRPPDVFHYLRHPPEDDQQLLRAGAAAHIAHWRHQQLQTLEASGVLTLDSELEELDGRLISRYLDVKARRLL